MVMTATPINTSTNGFIIGKKSNTDSNLSTGLRVWTGQVDEEYLNILKPWTKLAKIYREMSDDAIIGALFEAIITPLLATTFVVDSISENDKDKRAAEFLENNIFTIPGQEWLEHVEDMLEYLKYGFALSEKVLYKKPDGKLYIRTLIPIGQETLYRWGDRDEYGDVTGFTQLDPVNAEYRVAPMSKLLHFTWRTRKRSPMGQSILRSLYRPWYFKKNLETLEAIGVERDVGNVPVAKLSQEFYSGTDVDNRYANLKTSLENFRIDEAAYIILPVGVDVKAYTSGSKAYDTRAIIRDWQHIIRQRFFADFLALGSEQVGTQALAKEMNTFFKLALVSVQNKAIEVWNRQLVPWLFEQNNWKLDKYPKIRWNDPSAINIQSLAQAYSELVKNNLLIPTPLLQKYIREQLRLPFEDVENIEIKNKNIPVDSNKDKDTPIDKEPLET